MQRSGHRVSAESPNPEQETRECKRLQGATDKPAGKLKRNSFELRIHYLERQALFACLFIYSENVKHVGDGCDPWPGDTKTVKMVSISFPLATQYSRLDLGS